MNYGLHRLFLLAYLTELFVGQDYLARINLSQRKRERRQVGKAGGTSMPYHHSQEFEAPGADSLGPEMPRANVLVA